MSTLPARARYGSVAEMSPLLCRLRASGGLSPSQLARFLLWQGASVAATDVRLGRSYLEVGRCAALECGDPATVALAGRLYGLGQMFWGDARGALTTLSEAEHVSDVAHDALHGQVLRGLVLLFEGGVDAALTALEHAASFAIACPGSFANSAWHLTSAMAHLELGSPDRCRAELEAMREEVPAQLRPWFERTRMLLALQDGNPTQAQDSARSMLQRLNEYGHQYYAPECYWSLARLYAQQGDAGRSRAAQMECLRVAESAGMPLWMARAGRLPSVARVFPVDVGVSNRVRIRVLGGFEVRRGDRAVLSGHVLPLLLKYLACAPDRVRKDDELIDAVWPEKGIRRLSLQGWMSRLHAQLRGGSAASCIVRENQGYRLCFEENGLQLDLKLLGAVPRGGTVARAPGRRRGSRVAGCRA
ncbi:MAG: hypothetical protein ACYCW6_24095 [Candidatus Xenobia bacterium]